MAYLDVEGGKRLYFENYPGPGLPVVFAHGWGMSCRVWDTTVTALLEKGHHVVTFDQRACGLSDKDFADVSIGAAAGDVERLMAHNAISAGVIVGWSLGGAVSVEAARRLGKRCLGVVLTCAASPRFVQASDFPHGNTADELKGMIASLGADRANFLYQLSRNVCSKPVTEQVITWMWSIFMQNGPLADVTLAELGRIDQREVLSRLTIPVLSIYGEKDLIVDPGIGRAAAKLAPNGRGLELDGCGHAPHIEDGERYREALLSFLGTVSSKR